MKLKAPANLKMYSIYRNMEHEYLKNPVKQKINQLRIDGDSKDNESVKVIKMSYNSKPHLAASQESASANN